MNNNNSDNSNFYNSTNDYNQDMNNNNNNNNNNIYITVITNANSLKDKTKELERLLSHYYDKLTINVFTETCVPSSLSKTYLRFVHKNYSKAELSNYRPIGITSLAYKTQLPLLLYHEFLFCYLS